MSKRKIIFRFIVFSALFVAFQCANKGPITCEDSIGKLEKMQSEIQKLASSSKCTTTGTCRYIAFGSKPCGGPWSYLVYSTSIDTLKLQNLVSEYNELEHQLNIRCERISDCMMVSPPQGFKCENNTCIAIY